MLFSIVFFCNKLYRKKILISVKAWDWDVFNMDARKPFHHIGLIEPIGMQRKSEIGTCFIAQICFLEISRNNRKNKGFARIRMFGKKNYYVY
jgi:hypothetical protein